MDLNKLFVIRPTNEEQNDFIITVGTHLATEKHFKTKAEAIAYRDTPKWDMIVALMSEMFLIHETKKQNKDGNN